MPIECKADRDRAMRNALIAFAAPVPACCLAIYCEGDTRGYGCGS